MRAWMVRRTGQVTVEYFILFAVIGMVTVISIATLDDDVKQLLTNFYAKAADAVTK